jgi:LysM repeat protein
MKLRQKLVMVTSAVVLSLAMTAPALADTHTVQQGDTLWDLYGTRYPAVAAANGISNPDLIYPGQRVRTGTSVRHVRASGRLYVVKQGDTLWGLVGSRWPVVARANHLANPDLIYPGQRLRLSGGGSGSIFAVVLRRPAPVVSAPVSSGCRSSVTSAEQWIFDHESYGGSVTADNPVSTAFGIGQLLDYNRELYGARIGASPDTTDFCQQLTMFRLYVSDRYGSAEAAMAFWISHGWY